MSEPETTPPSATLEKPVKYSTVQDPKDGRYMYLQPRPFATSRTLEQARWYKTNTVS